MTTVTRAKVIRDDLALFDGKNRTYQRPDATGGTKTGLRINDFVDVLQVFGDGSSRTRGTISNAVSNIGSSVASLRFAPGTWTIDADLTVPATLAALVSAGCVFDIASGVTLTFAGPVHVEYSAADGTGWYTGDGSIVCSQGATGIPGVVNECSYTR